MGYRPEPEPEPDPPVTDYQAIAGGLADKLDAWEELVERPAQTLWDRGYRQELTSDLAKASTVLRWVAGGMKLEERREPGETS